MSEPRYESIVRELRETAPPAPDALRERVGALREPQPKRAWRLRPALAAAAALAVTVGVGAAAIGGLTGSTAPQAESLRQTAFQPADSAARPNGASAGGSAYRLQRDTQSRTLSPMQPEADDGSVWSATGDTVLSASAKSANHPVLTPGSRLQQYGVSMSLRVKDLSGATQKAVRQTRRLGGYVAAADYATGSSVGDSRLELRVPVSRIQAAIAQFTDLGTILSQRISVDDLQAPLDRTEARMAAQRKVIAQLEALGSLTPEQQTQLDTAKRTLQRLIRSRSNIVRQGTYASVSLLLTTRKTAAKHVAPGRFDRFWGDAGDILGKEAIVVLYALVVVGPFALLAALALFGERARRRRADHRLLGETG